MALDSATLDALLDTVRKFVRGRLVPLEQQVAREDLLTSSRTCASWVCSV